MRMQNVRTVGALLSLVVVGGLVACHGPTKSSAASGAPEVKVNPSNMQAAARAGVPANATQATSIGTGALAINTANSPTDTDSFWIAQFDIDGDGDLEDTQFLWDDEDRVLFAFSEAEMTCANGGVATAAVLAGVNGEGNPRGRRAGSGFFAAALDATECEAAVAGLYAATFDANGRVTAWASATINQAQDTVILARSVTNPMNPFN